MKRALICGVTGQDGAYLAQFLLQKGYEVWGTSRDAHTASLSNLSALDVATQVELKSMAVNDFRSVLQVIAAAEPDEIYNLCGQTSVGLSFEQPVQTLESIGIANLYFLEAIRFLAKPVRYYNAGSSEMFGNCADQAANELSAFNPRSPYAVAKCTAFWQVANYREAYDLHACSGILFNHESPLRASRFVTQKVVQAACRIAAGSDEKLALGQMSIIRDWGWAPEYIEAMWRILQHDEPLDFVVATGQKNSLQDFVAKAFSSCDLDWREHVTFDEKFLRPTDLQVSVGDPTKIAKVLGWQATSTMKDVVENMVAFVRSSRMN